MLLPKSFAAEQQSARSSGGVAGMTCLPHMDIKAAAGTEIYRHQKKNTFQVLTDDGAREGVGVIQRGASAKNSPKKGASFVSHLA